jgi:2-amino-4-hydroxy-6-hydroxymethyldihydropteridine diphosphokinase
VELETSPQSGVPGPRPNPTAAGRSRSERPSALRGVFLALGSNLGDRLAHLSAGLVGLAARGVRPVACSTVYRTAPVGGPPQGDFLNLVVEAETELGPDEVLRAALAVEAARGRVRSDERWGPRSLDVDLLLFRDRVVTTDELHLPHPRLHLRRFVLIPLSDLAPGLVHPVRGERIDRLLAACPDVSMVTVHHPPLPLPDAVGA